jgi:iron complex transport system substrate-binding protein
VLLLALGLLAAACGSDQVASGSRTTDLAGTNASTSTISGRSGASGAGGEGTAPGASGFPVTVAAANGPVTLKEAPRRIVSLSASATESLFAIDAGDQVKAVDDHSNYPPGVPTSSLSAYQPNVEAITAYDPDLVVASDDIGELVAGLTKVGIPVALQPAPKTIDDAYGQIRQLGQLTGHTAEADKLVASMQQRISRAAAAVPKGTKPLTYYHELDNTYYSVASKAFIGQIYALAGLVSIADTADKSGTGYPQLSSEYIVSADPDLIFLADTKCCGQSAETVRARPGWSKMRAVTGNHVVALDDDIASRWGPRIVDLLRQVIQAVKG